MTETSNPYKDYVRSKGRDISGIPAPIPSYPRTIGLRTFQTHEEYLEALHDYLNGC